MRWISSLWWLLALGFLGLYAYTVVTGLLGPAEVVLVSVAAVTLAVLWVIHAARVHHALIDPHHPDHAAIMRGLHRYRERRGF
jgi:hypothetical protein